MKTNIHHIQKAADSTAAEQAVIGAILMDNNAVDRIPTLKAAHFYHRDHQLIYTEILRQLNRGKTVDPITLFEALHDKVDNCIAYLNECLMSVGSAAGITRYAETIIDRAIKREMAALGSEIQEWKESAEPAMQIVDRAAGRLEKLAQTNTRKEPQLLRDMLVSYADLLQARMEGRIKPISTGYRDLDRQMGGGLERGTLTVVAGRPAMGKTAFGLAMARNVAVWGSSLFLSMEMPAAQVTDRNVSALGKIPLSWLTELRHGRPDDPRWENVTHAFTLAEDMKLFVDDQTALNMMEIRAKARGIKRQHSLDLLVIDQLSFITGGDSEKLHEQVGEYTRGLLGIARELDIAVVLLCQLNRELERRPNKRPIMADLALSGSIEQDAGNIIFLYRDEVYDPDTRDKGVAEAIIAKQRQGQPGVVGLAYIGEQTRFEDLAHEWKPEPQQSRSRASRFE